MVECHLNVSLVWSFNRVFGFCVILRKFKYLKRDYVYFLITIWECLWVENYRLNHYIYMRPSLCLYLPLSPHPSIYIYYLNIEINILLGSTRLKEIEQNNLLFKTFVNISYKILKLKLIWISPIKRQMIDKWKIIIPYNKLVCTHSTQHANRQAWIIPHTKTHKSPNHIAVILSICK